MTDANQNLPLPVDELRNDCNGNSSPDSGVNDMSDERPASVISVGSGDDRIPSAEARRRRNQKQEHKITLLGDECLRIQLPDNTVRHVLGPANIAMIANNRTTGPLPIHAPHGHMVQRILDENSGGVPHIILRPRHPNITQGGPGGGQMSHGGGGGGGSYPYHGGSQQMPITGGGPHHPHYNYPGPGSQPGGFGPGSQPPSFPAGYHPQYHHHLMQQAGGNLHPLAHNGGSGPSPNNNHGSGGDDRLQPQQRPGGGGRHRDKSSHHPQHRHKNNNSDIMSHHPQAQCYNGHNGSLDLNSCSSSTDSHDTTSDDEKRILYDILSSIQPPQVEVESRRAVVHITSPNIPDNLIPLDQPINTEVNFQLQYTDKKDGPYKPLYKGDATTIKMQDLRPATEHFIRVSAILDDISGSFTDPVIFETLPAPPDAPLAPKLCSKSKNYILLKWNATTDNGRKILHYLLEYYKGHDLQANPYAECYLGLKKEYKVAKLVPSQRYTFRLAAVNDCGKSEYSKEVTICTNGTAPPPPDAPRLSEATLNSLLLTWIKRPGVDKEFVLQREEENTGHGFMASYHGPEVSYKVDKLRKSTMYKFRLQASNEDGKSSWSQVVTYKTRADLPGAPTKLSVKGKTLSNTFRLAWEPPRENGGSDIQTYCAQLDSGDGYQSVYKGNACECSCIDLLPGFTYKARVAAENSVGLGRWSDPAHVTTKPVSPGQCGKPWLLGKPKAHCLHLKWTSPENTGGAPIQFYIVQLIKMDNTTTEVYKGRDTDCVVAGLSPGRSYLLQVRALNEAGVGDWSETLEVISGAGIPERPLPTICLVRSAHAIHVSWQAPCNNGAKISEYKLEWLKSNTQEYVMLFTGSELEYEVKSLQANSQYAFRVQAVNSSGASPASSSVAVTTLPSSPAAVHRVRATPSATSIIVIWAEPDHNGSDITHYNVEYGKHQLSVEAGETECVIENLDPDTLYRTRVQAVNAVGAGAYSAQVKVTTLSLPPSPPCLECVATTWNSIKLRWAEVEKCDEYTVWMSRTESGSPQCVYQGLSQQCRIAKLHESTDYYFSISAHNSAGEGPLSDPLIVTTSRAPPHSLKAPVIGELGEDYCDVSWQTVKPFPGDAIEYRLQLSEQQTSSSAHDYKQVRQSTETTYQLRSLTPGYTYSARVCAVRICGAAAEPIVGAYSPGITFKTHKPLPAAPSSKAADLPSQESALRAQLVRVVNAVTPKKENQMAVLAMLLLFVVSVVLAGLAHYFIS